MQSYFIYIRIVQTLTDRSCLLLFIHREQKKNQVPETVTEEGSARRNIIRKHDFDPKHKEKKQGGGGGGKGKWNDLDDGSMEDEE